MRASLGGVVAAACLVASCGGSAAPGEEGAPARRCDVSLQLDLGVVADVGVAGEFSNWEPVPLRDVGGGTFQAALGVLDPGTYAYKLVYGLTGASVRYEGQPPPDVRTKWFGGVENRALVVGDCQQPSLMPVTASVSAEGDLSATFSFLRAADGPPLDVASVTATVGDLPGEIVADPETGEITVSATGLPAGKWSVRVWAADEDGAGPEEGEAYYPLWVEPEPFDWRDGVLYYAFLDRFRDGGPDGIGATPLAQEGTDYMGGDLVGLKQAIEEGWLDQLGVRSIWLSPVADNPTGAYGGPSVFYTGYHGYWPTSDRAVEERLGTTDVSPEQALEDVISAAHARGIRVLFDVVLNHVHEDHNYLTEHPEWFTADPCPCTTDAGPCNWDSAPLTCWFDDFLPDLDFRNHDIVARALDDALWWWKRFDADGFRVDAAKHMDHVILRTLRLRVEEELALPGAPEPWLVGETFVFKGGQGLIMDYVADHELHGQFDFPLYYALREALLGGGWNVASTELKSGISAYGRFLPRMSPFMGNHDVSRFATDIQGCPNYRLFGGCPDLLMDAGPTDIPGPAWEVINRMSQAYAVVATHPGVPLLYYGDEIGLAGAGDPDNRRMMDWGPHSAAQQELLGRIRALGSLRSTTRALQRGDWQEIWVDGELWVYVRNAGENDVALVALRRGGSGTRTQEIPVPAETGLDGRTLTDALAGRRSVSVGGGRVSVTLDPWEYVVMLP